MSRVCWHAVTVLSLLRKPVLNNRLMWILFDMSVKLRMESSFVATAESKPVAIKTKNISRIMILSSTVYEIWLIDHIWPVFSNDLDLQGHVIFRQPRKFVFWIPFTWKPYNRHQNNCSITYSSWDIETYNFWRPSWTPSCFVSFCRGCATPTMNCMILLYHTKRLTPTASSHH